MAVVWLVIALVAGCGCGASQRDAMLAAYEAQQRACLLLDDLEAAEQCVEDVRFAWRPVWAREDAE